MTKISMQLVAFAILLISCNTETQNAQKNEPKIEKDTTKMVGNDSDEHGCKGSAGYQWSPLKNNCIRLFEDGIRLDAKYEKLDKTVSAFIVFKSENIEDSVELHLPFEKGLLILLQDKTNGAGKWTNDKYELTQWKGMYSLENKSKKIILYQGSAVK